MHIEDFIQCPRFGGRRPPLACMHYDRFKSCRRHCDKLAAWMKANPDHQTAAEAMKEQRPQLVQVSLIPSKHSGKGLPDPAVACRRCRFTAKSPRGLKAHMTRSHKVRA